MDPEHVAEAALSSRLNTGRGGSDSAQTGSQIPLLTYENEVRNPKMVFISLKNVVDLMNGFLTIYVCSG